MPHSITSINKRFTIHQSFSGVEKSNVKYLFTLAILILGLNTLGQIPNDSIYNGWWGNKGRSIFNAVDEGEFYGKTSGYIYAVREQADTLLLDFKTTAVTLNINKDNGEEYDNSTKYYSTKTTSGKTSLKYSTYALANVLSIRLNGEVYEIGAIDGASDMPIIGLTFNYCSEGNEEYLTLFVTKSLELNTTRHLMRSKKIRYMEAKRIAKTLMVLPGSTIIMRVKK